MRALPSGFGEYQFTGSKEPRVVVEIAFATDDLVYLTSHADAPTPTGAVVVAGSIIKVASTTQSIEPDQGRSTIGTISIDVLDKASAFTNILGARDSAGKGLRYKRVRVYQGFRGMDWAALSTNLIQTQIADDLRYSEGKYTIVCADVQRSIRNDIFTLAATTLSSGMTADQMLVPVWSVDGFYRVAHGATYSDAPSQEVGYLKIEDEVIRWTGTTTDGTLGLCFVVGQRGALGTKAVEHLVDSSTSSDRTTEVTEFVYLELPAIKLAYAILTGNLYGQTGKELPPGWHLNIPGEYIRTADFVNIGNDLWNPSTDDGVIVRFAGEDEQDGKQFIEQQLCLMLACFMPIYSNGELGMRRFTSVLHNAPHVWEINDTNAVKYGELSIDIRSVHNVLSVAWNYDHLQEKLTRQKILVDQVSRDKYGATPTKTLEFRGLHGSRHTKTTVEGLFDRLRDRYAAPPQKLSVRCLPYLNFLEVGDIVRVRTSGVRDYFGGVSGIDRAFEIQRVQVDWVTGQVDLQLFGSTQPAGPIAPENPGNGNPDAGNAVLPDGWYTGSGTNITAMGAAVTTSITGGVRHITGGTGIVGSDSVGGTRIYCDGDLELDAGVVLPFTKNVMLVVRGHLQINGTFDGEARGHAGAAALSGVYTNIDNHNAGVSGYIGPTISGGGIYFIGSGTERGTLRSDPGFTTQGQVAIPPRLNLDYVGGQLIGIPTNLQGTSGSTGRGADTESSNSSAHEIYPGGAGGAGGAGLVIVARGVSFGAAGAIKTSGGDAEQKAAVAASVTHNGFFLRPGVGAAGAPGAIYFLIDGIDNEIPGLAGVEALYGDPNFPTSDTVLESAQKKWENVSDGDTVYSHYTGYGNTQINLSGYNGAARIQYVPPVNVPVEDVPQETSAPVGLALSQIANMPPTIDQSLTTIEVTVTPPGDGNYSYSNIYIKRSSSSAWNLSGPADDEWTIAVQADGATYDVQARPVSIFGIESPTGPQASITIGNSSSALSPPADVRDIHTNYKDGFVEVYWAAVSDVRGADYEIRKGSSWVESVVIGRTSVNRLTINQAGTYWFCSRVLGYSGESIYSNTPASVSISSGYITNNVIASYDEFVSGLPGTLDSGALIVSSKIRLQGTANFLAISDILAETNILGVGSYVASGTYSASTHTINVGRDAPCPISVVFASHNEDANGNIMDAALTNVRPQINVGNNAGTYAGWQDYKPGTYYGRYFQFRLLLESLDGTSTPVITAFAFSVDVPDRIDTGNITTSASGAITLTHSPAFNGGNGPSGVPVVTASIVGGSAGDQLYVTSISNASVNFQVINAGSSVARTVHYSIQGY